MILDELMQAHTLKKNIGQFSGYVWVESEVLHLKLCNIKFFF